MPDQNTGNQRQSMLSAIVDFFLYGSLTPVLILFALVAGAIAITFTAREEEPQIIVPMADVHILAPGLPVEEIERQVASPLEKLLFQIDGVEHVYSTSASGRATVTVRFFVGEDREDSLVKIYNKIYSNTDQIPPDVASWVVKPIEVDDVPIVIVTLWSDRPDQIDDYGLRRIADELENELQALPNTNRTEVVGGRPRVVRVELDAEALAARQTSALDVAWALEVSNVRRPTGSIDQSNRNIIVEAGDYFGNAEALGNAVVNVVDGNPVLLKDVATIVDGPAERTGYSWIGFGPAENVVKDVAPFLPAVHVSVAKKKGTNAVDVARSVEARVRELEAGMFPEGVHARITRNHGETANAKVNELLEAFAVAIIIVIGLIAYTLGWREGLVVAAAVPITFAITLMINYWAGYTINRVTLFALILSLGLVVDDPIVGVENIFRHLKMAAEPPLQAVRSAVNEVLPPIVLATLTVIVAFLPLYFITGMMGPYMSPMALNVPVAMLTSMFVAFTITPWLAYKLLKHEGAKSEEGEPDGKVKPSGLHRIYAWAMMPFLDNRKRAYGLLLTMVLLFAGAVALGLWRAVPLKMLPFDNKNEFQVVVDMPEGTTIERTDAVTRQLAEVLRRVPEVRDFEVFSGMASPMDFNGMVRHYFLRAGANVADIRVNLVDKRNRTMQSHEIALRLRDDLEAVAGRADAKISIVEVPAGPPVISTLTGEITAEPQIPYAQFRRAAEQVEERLRLEPGVSDVDSSVEAPAGRLMFVTDQEKAALSGIASDDISRTVALALGGLDVARMHLPGEVNPLPVRLRLARSERSGVAELNELSLKGRQGITKVREHGGVRDASVPFVRLGELGRFEQREIERAIYHKDLQRVAYVYAEAVGRAPAEIAADVAADMGARVTNEAVSPRPLSTRSYVSNGGGIPWSLPPGTSVSWLGEGELNITVDVFRDLGIAFAIALLGIYMILVYQTKSYAMPLILMISIPLTLIGIMPGFWLLNLVTAGEINGYANPTFFTATAMIGMIALAGIAVRNAILLIEFLHTGLERGLGLKEAIIAAGAVRTRAILLTAGTAMLAALPITLDPIFSGLAWALIFGLFVSTAFTLLVVPTTYHLVYANRPGHGLASTIADGSDE